MNVEERKKAEENIGLVHKVISDKVHGTFQYGMYSREDLFQIGCIGLCKAVVSDRGGCFSTYAYRLIWNEICDALVSSTRNGKRETEQRLTADSTASTAGSGKGWSRRGGEDDLRRPEMKTASMEALQGLPRRVA